MSFVRRYQRAISRASEKRHACIILLIGSTQSGKTSLAQRFLNHGYDNSYAPTVEERYQRTYEYKGIDLNLDIIDMCAPFVFPVMRDLNSKSAHIVLLVYEIGNMSSVKEAVKAFDVINVQRPTGLYTVVVGTKLDLYPGRISIEEYRLTDEFKMLPAVNGGHVLTSAKNNVGVTQAFAAGLERYIEDNLHTTGELALEGHKACLIM